MSTDRYIGPGLRDRADELSDKLRLVRDALSLDLGDGVDVVDGARQCREERDRLSAEVAHWRSYMEQQCADHPESEREWMCISCLENQLRDLPSIGDPEPPS
jgi:hypothetical protein